MLSDNNFKLGVGSEVGTLKALLIHSPDSGLGKVVPSKAQDWLFEDIVHLDTMRKNEYDHYVKLLLYFLDPEKIKGRLEEVNSRAHNRAFFKPDNAAFHASTKVIELEMLLADILADESICEKLVASVCAIEGCNYRLQQQLIETPPIELAKIFISGAMGDDNMIFAPIPNLIFSRDIGIVINSHILINKPAKKARSRETLLVRYIFFNHPLFVAYRDNIIEIPETVQHFLRPGEDTEGKTTLEGGDVMVVAPNHVIIGCSERTSVSGANEAIKLLFENKVVNKVTVVKIPHKRDYMHIDTIFTQVKRDTWVMLGSLSKKDIDPETAEPTDWLGERKGRDKVEIFQFEAGELAPRRFASIEELLDDVSRNDLGSSTPTRFIYSGNGIFPYDSREQWTDSCNLLALREGVVLGYDRNTKTVEAFRQNGFKVIKVADLLRRIEDNEADPDTMQDTLILMPSAELSRARGGFHCMSMPILRYGLNK
ncbi:arginine deiminase [Mucilaginibacter yixingensis]|uniref:arginine deiminase n=1 Tax=Mucilaginibacter yixingensis TaxID=1295612 RepID=A0A2T5JAV9_9SPHI|nr:arginine deiminase family protein [Mucilaginibacter yixingensis]PTQ98004.1 arginine deiminase [Mucilaginibacter yixingensis]